MINFLNIPGLTEIKGQLLGRILGGNLPNTVLLSGQEGGGALPVAISLAKSLVCLRLTKEGSCEQCVNCIQFNGQNYPDLHLTFPIERKGKESSSADFKTEFFSLLNEKPFLTNQSWRDKLSVGNKQLLIPARESDNIIHNLALTTFSQSPRVFIIWQPELLNITASNRLLKSLEEPGDNSYFILVSHNTEKVLETILSRCVAFSVPKNSSSDIESYLSKLGYPDTSVTKALLYAEGSIGSALDQLDQEEITNEHYDKLITWFRSLYSGNVNELVVWTEKTSTLYREQIKQFLLYAMQLIQQAAGISVGSHEGPTFKHDTFDIERFAPFIRVEKMNDILSAMDRAYKDIERNGNPKIVLLDLSLILTKYIGKA